MAGLVTLENVDNDGVMDKRTAPVWFPQDLDGNLSADLNGMGRLGEAALPQLAGMARRAVSSRSPA